MNFGRRYGEVSVDKEFNNKVGNLSNVSCEFSICYAAS